MRAYASESVQPIERPHRARADQYTSPLPRDARKHLCAASGTSPPYLLSSRQISRETRKVRLVRDILPILAERYPHPKSYLSL